jgi:hypothetical protein
MAGKADLPPAATVWSREDYRAYYDKGDGNPPVRGLVEAKGRSFRFRVLRHGMAQSALRAIVTWALRLLRSWKHGRDALLPLGTESAGRTWLHRGCRDVWHADRRAKAFAALAEVGITHPRPITATKESSDSSGDRTPVLGP